MTARFWSKPHLAASIVLGLLGLMLAPTRMAALPTGAFAAGIMLLWRDDPVGLDLGLFLAALGTVGLLVLGFSPGDGTLMIVVGALALRWALRGRPWPIPEGCWMVLATGAALAAIFAPVGPVSVALLGVAVLVVAAPGLDPAPRSISLIRGAGFVLLMAVALSLVQLGDMRIAALLSLAGGLGYALIMLEAGPRAGLLPVAALMVLWRFHPAGLSELFYAWVGLILSASALVLFIQRPRARLRSPWSYAVVAQIGVLSAAIGLEGSWGFYPLPIFTLPVGLGLVQLWRAQNPTAPWALLALVGFPPFALFVGDMMVLHAVSVRQPAVAILLAISLLTIAMTALIRLRGVRL